MLSLIVARFFRETDTEQHLFSDPHMGSLVKATQK
jgi:hypothetical protein